MRPRPREQRSRITSVPSGRFRDACTEASDLCERPAMLRSRDALERSIRNAAGGTATAAAEPGGSAMSKSIRDFTLGGITAGFNDQNAEIRFIKEMPECAKQIWAHSDTETIETFRRILASGRAPSKVAELFVFFIAGQAHQVRLTLE